jgi:predicted double-glycine peptidase
MISLRVIFRVVLTAFSLFLFSQAAFGGEVVLPDTGYTVHVKSVQERKESRVVRQDYDFSCGSAAVATLLTYSYDMPTTEREAFDTMYKVGDQEHIKQYGFSLLDMQKYLEQRGLHAVGYKLTLEKLRKLQLPAIALINPNGYNHFVVVRGWKNNEAVVADPRLGLRRIPADDFKAMWNGIVFVLKDNEKIGQLNYNDPQDLKLIPRSFTGDGLYYAHASAADTLINIPIFNDY